MTTTSEPPPQESRCRHCGGFILPDPAAPKGWRHTQVAPFNGDVACPALPSNNVAELAAPWEVVALRVMDALNQAGIADYWVMTPGLPGTVHVDVPGGTIYLCDQDGGFPAPDSAWFVIRRRSNDREDTLSQHTDLDDALHALAEHVKQARAEAISRRARYGTNHASQPGTRER